MTVDDVLPLLVAPFVGSFLGVLVRRLPRGVSVVRGRSACESCGAVLGPLDLIPLLSALVLRGRCRRCGVPFSPVHWWMELAAVAVALVAVLAEGEAGAVWAGCVLGWGLLTLGVIDFQHLRLPDALTLPLLLCGLCATALLTPEALPAHAAAAAGGFLLLRAVALGYRALRGREGMGGGDAKLLAAAGAWTGPDGLPAVLLLAAALGLALALVERLRGRSVTATTAVPFGPGLALATWAAWLAEARPWSG